MNYFFDLDGNPLSAAALDIGSGESKQLLIKIRCEAGKKLVARVAGDITISGKQEDEVTEADLLSEAGLSLAPHAGLVEVFEINLTAATVSTTTERAVALALVNS